MKYNPSPIGAIIHDFDFYSSTKIALSMLKADMKFFLPRMYCYFDDTIGNETELFNDFTGERLAINEFNSQNEDIKFSFSYLSIRDYPNTNLYVIIYFKIKLINNNYSFIIIRFED